MIRLRRWLEEEGGAAVEFALTTMLIVPAALYTVYAGEAVVVSIKAQEAEISAGWEITAYRFHDHRNGGAVNYAAVSQAAAQRVGKGLKDFDSFSTADTEGRIYTLGEAKFTGVTCALRSGNAAPGDFGLIGLGRGHLHGDGWVGCQARVEFANKNMSRQAHEEFYDHGRPQLLPDAIAQLPQMCGLGRDYKGCQASKQRGFLVLTDDWGLENPRPTHVKDYGSGNPDFYGPGDAIFVGLPGAAAVNAAMLFLIGNGDQGDTGKFKMGYLNRVGDKETIKAHPKTMKLHLSPYHEAATDATRNEANLSQNAHNLRVSDHYLGMTDPDWNGR